MTYTKIYLPGLQAWLVAYDASVITFLDAQGRNLLEKLCTAFHGAMPVVVLAQSEDTTAGDGWPKVIAHKFTATISGEEVATASTEYVNWNPRDGENWSLSISFTPPDTRMPLWIVVKDNQTEGYFDVGWHEGEEQNLKKLRELLESNFLH